MKHLGKRRAHNLHYFDEIGQSMVDNLILIIILDDVIVLCWHCLVLWVVCLECNLSDVLMGVSLFGGVLLGTLLGVSLFSISEDCSVEPPRKHYYHYHQTQQVLNPNIRANVLGLSAHYHHHHPTSS
jgi:hypothetical protein